MVIAGYIRYLQKNVCLEELTNDLGEAKAVLMKSNLINKIVEEFNKIQQEKRDCNIRKFDRDVEYGIISSAAIKRINHHAYLNDYYPFINYKEAKKILKGLAANQ